MRQTNTENMDGSEVCAPLQAETDDFISNYISSSPNAASVTDADKVINTEIDSPQVEGGNSEEELLKGLLSDTYCHLCEAVLLFESQKVSHYEGKKHAQRVQMYLQTKRDEKKNKESAAPQQAVSADKNRLCELCNRVFNSDLVAKSHYEGKIHAKNLRKKGLLPQANTLMCQICNLQFHSAENYQAHIEGNKHQVRQRKVKDLCNSKQKVYNSFADELADYIQAQKARGLTPKTCEVQKDEEERDEAQEAFEKNDNHLNASMPDFSTTSDHPHQSRNSYYLAGGWCPPRHGPVWPPHSWDYSYHPPVLPGSHSKRVARQSMKRRRHRKQSSSSSSYSTSSSDSLSSSSSYSSSASDSDDSEHDQRGKRGVRKSKKGQGEEKGRKRLRKDGGDEKMRRKGGNSEQERREKRRKHSKWRRKDKTSPDDVIETGEGGKGAAYRPKRDGMMDTRQCNEVHLQTKLNVGEEEEEEDDSDKSKNRKEKRKTKEKEDTRTEEEKLWDDSILGF